MDEQKVQQGIERQQVQKEVKRRTQSSRQRIQERTREYGTLTNALLNGSLVKWLFLLFMLVGVITLFNSNSDNHWIHISNQDGQDKYTFNLDAYEIDYMMYSNIGERMISNFSTLQTTIDNGKAVFLFLNDIRLWVTDVIQTRPRLIPPITGPVIPIVPWFR
jgi:hypothetical protein